MISIKGSSHNLNGPQLGSAKSYAGLGLFIVNDVVSFDYQNET